MNAPIPVHRLRDSVKSELCFRLPGGTLDEFCEWLESDLAPEEVHFSYMDGQIEVDTSAEDMTAHNRVKTIVTRVLGNLVEQHDLGEIVSDGMVYVSPEARVAHAPDAMFVSWESLATGQVFYQPSKRYPDCQTEVRGKPDLVVEVVSNSSVDKDTGRLPKTYYAAGVREYWILDARGPKPDFRILVRGKRKYTVRQAGSLGFVHSDVFHRAFRLVRHKNRMNHVAFRLEQRSTAD